MATTPTSETYDQFDEAHAYFNKALFDSQLPKCLIVLRRNYQSMGHFAFQRWVNVNCRKTDEIVLNPAYFATHSVMDILQTLVHEMCHQWQAHYGTPTRNGYHNIQWANKMQLLGLMPSSTGLPGGAKTGQRMGDYVIPGGRFERHAMKLIENQFTLPMVDCIIASKPSAQIRGLAEVFIENTDCLPVQMTIADQFPEVDLICQHSTAIEHENLMKKRKITYKCPSCGAKAWGKSRLAITCANCRIDFKEIFIAA